MQEHFLCILLPEILKEYDELDSFSSGILGKTEPAGTYLDNIDTVLEFVDNRRNSFCSIEHHWYHDIHPCLHRKIMLIRLLSRVCVGVRKRKKTNFFFSFF